MVLRGATAEDEAFLWEMLLHAAHAGDEVESTEALKGVPGLAPYVEGWGRPTDLGIIATEAGGGEPIGAAWLRLIAAYGFVDDRTPELAIAVAPGAVGQGIGTAMLRRLLVDAERMFPAVSLSVRADNPALRLYGRLGFVPVEGSEGTNRVGGVSLTMVRRFGGVTAR